METPENLPDPARAPWRDLVETPPLPTSAEVLRSVINRRDRRLSRGLAGALAVALVAGPAIGFAIGHSNASSKATVAVGTLPASGGAADSAAAPANAAAGAAPGAITAMPYPGGLTKPTQLFLRNASGGVRIRAYLNTFASAVARPNCIVVKGSNGTVPCVPPLAPVPACSPTGYLEAQLSNDQVAGTTGATFFGAPPAGTIRVLAATVVGALDPTPIGTVFVQAGSGIDKVRLVLPDGTSDEMAPKSQLAVLAQQVTVTLQAIPVPVPSEPSHGPANSSAPASGAGPVTPATGATSGRSQAAPGQPPASAPLIKSVFSVFPKGTKVEALAGGKVVQTVDLSAPNSIGGPGGPSVMAPGCVLNGGTGGGVGPRTGGGNTRGPPPTPAPGQPQTTPAPPPAAGQPQTTPATAGAAAG